MYQNLSCKKHRKLRKAHNQKVEYGNARSLLAFIKSKYYESKNHGNSNADSG